MKMAEGICRAVEMPLKGYNVVVNGGRMNDKLLTDCIFSNSALPNGTHKVTVDVVYDDTRIVKSEPVTFQIVNSGIEAVTTDDVNGVKYDIQGRRIISDKSGRSLFIMNNKKYIK